MSISQYYGVFLPNVQWARSVGTTPNDPGIIANGQGGVVYGDGGPEQWYLANYASLGAADSIDLIMSRKAPTGARETIYTDSNATGDFTTTLTQVGAYQCIYNWSWGLPGRDWWYLEHFDVVDPSGGSSGTDGAGRIIAIKSFEPPGVVHVVYETINGDLVAKQNPQ